jgi:subtilisin family serine protease
LNRPIKYGWILLLAALSSAAAQTSPAVQVGGPAPDFSLTNLNGQTLQPSQAQGRDLLLVFGTTWCPHCRDLMPQLSDIQDRSSARLTVWFLCVRQNERTALDFYRGQAMTYEVLPDPDGAVAAAYGIDRIPTSVFIDRKGILRWIGPINPGLVADLLDGVPVPQPPAKPAPDLKVRHLTSPPAKRPAAPARRFIVDLDEPPDRALHLTEQARQLRRDHLRTAVRRIGGTIIHDYGKWKNRIVVDISPNQVGRLSELPGFRSAKEDTKVHALLADSAYQIHADYAWANAITGQGVKVCVVDTGIDYNHPDLRNKVVNQINTFAGTDDAMDDNGHGTHVAGIIASEGVVYRGVSNDVSLLAAKVLGANGDGYASDVALGIQWCVAQGARVINMSLGEGLYPGTCDNTEMAIAVNEAVDAGVMVVCASGNDGDPGGIVSPACASKAIAVGSVDKTDAIASYSDGGPELDLVAPGGDQFGGSSYAEIVSTFSTLVANDPDLCFYDVTQECYDNYFVVDGLRYIRAVGTSMAAPHVAGAAALILEANPSLTPLQVKTLLEETADDLGDPGWDNIFGHGRINVEKALNNLPAQLGELKISITDPNAAAARLLNEAFALSGLIECYGGDGCGTVQVAARFCEGIDCTNFAPLTADSSVSTASPNPVDLGQLSGATVDVEAPLAFDAETILDISESSYQKILSPANASVGSTMPSQYHSGDLEPEDGLGAIGENVEKLYAFTLPEGQPAVLKIRMEHYLVLQQDDPNSGWRFFVSDAQGNNLAIVGDCTPETGGGGDPPPPDCWWVSRDPAVLSVLHPGLNYIKLMSFDVGEDDWLTFNNIEVFVDFAIDPANDWQHRYTVKFDLSAIDTAKDITAARLSINVSQAAAGAMGEIHWVDPAIQSTDPASTLHNAALPTGATLTNPVKSFSAGNTGPVNINLKAVIDDALRTGHKAVALQIREQGDDQLLALSAGGSANKPRLVLSQRSDQAPPPPADPSPIPPPPGPHNIVFDAAVVKKITDGSYTKTDAPPEAEVGSTIAAEFNTGNLEPEGGMGAVGEDAAKVYEISLPAGTLRQVRVRMENYIVLQQDEPPAGWYLFTSDADGNELHLLDECTPLTGGGGEPPPPDCWFISSDPAVLADFHPGASSFIKLRSHNVAEFDWLSFNVLELIAEYEVDPANDQVHRYYMRFDLSSLSRDDKIDSAIVNLTVSRAAAGAVGEFSVVNNTYDAGTGALTIYNAEDAAYSSLPNPFKTFAADTAGLKRVNIRAAVEDAVSSGASSIAIVLTEEQENALFAVAGSASVQPPTLDVYLKSGLNSGTAQWTARALREGNYLLQLRAETSTGAVADSQVIPLIVENPDRPRIQSVECRIGGQWKDCRTALYNQTIESIRVAATDPQETPTVHLTLSNLPEAKTFLDTNVAFSGGYFTQTANQLIRDSGQWDLFVRAADSQGNFDERTISWQIPWGELTAQLLAPTAAVLTPKGNTLTVSAKTTCAGGECPDVAATVILNDPVERAYDDGTAEDYGDIGSTDAFLAVRITPTEYPAVLKTARFYIWDQTTYPFELHVWDDNGSGGSPGVELMTPMVVDPVNSSAGQVVSWFDVDLSDRNITIPSGDLYIGWRQLEDTRNNQVGFDTSGPQKMRTWAYLAFLGGWFNLDDYCSYDPQFCGNIMIRAILGSEGYFSGILPATTMLAPFYAPTGHPASCGDLADGQTCTTNIPLLAVGQVGDKAKLMVRAANAHSLAETASVTATVAAAANPFKAANLDGVGPVNLEDFAILAHQWLATQKPLFADINNDKIVNLADLTLLANYWLSSNQ